MQSTSKRGVVKSTQTGAAPGDEGVQPRKTSRTTLRKHVADSSALRRRNGHFTNGQMTWMEEPCGSYAPARRRHVPASPYYSFQSSIVVRILQEVLLGTWIEGPRLGPLSNHFSKLNVLVPSARVFTCFPSSLSNSSDIGKRRSRTEHWWDSVDAPRWGRVHTRLPLPDPGLSWTCFDAGDAGDLRS